MKKILNKIWSLAWWIKLLMLILLGVGSYKTYTLVVADNTTVSYQTSKVTSGTLITSISASGSISAGNTANIETKASGTVKTVKVKNGDSVTKGQTLLTITLDSEGIERRSSAWKSYLASQEAVAVVSKNKQDLEIEVWKDKQAILDAQDKQEKKNLNTSENTDAENNQIDLGVTQAKLGFDVTAAKYAHTDDEIAAAKIAMNASYRDYLDVSGTIVAPADGIVNNLTLTVGSTLSASSSQSTTSGASYASSQTIGFVRSSNNEYLAKVSLTEVDVTKVKAGQKVNLTMDAHSDKSFTGHVLAVDVSGTISSGVVSYPATIVMDGTELPIFPNMSVSATIITSTTTDALIVPSSAITTKDGVSNVSILKNGIPEIVNVEIGNSNDTQTIVKSGLASGEEVVTGSGSSVKNNNTTSAFSSNRQNGSTSRTSIPMGGPGF